MDREQTLKLCCSFCGKSQHEVRKLIAGPTVYICDQCIKLCNDILGEDAKRAKSAPEQKAAPPRAEGTAETPNQTLCCSFCGKSQRKVKNLIAGPSTYICDECIGLCNDIIAEEIEREDVTARLRSSLPEAARVLIGAVLGRGSSAAERIFRFTRERESQIHRAIHDRYPDVTPEQFGRRYLEESHGMRPPQDVLLAMSTLASKWIDLSGLVGVWPSEAAEQDTAAADVAPLGQPPKAESEPEDWLRQITERLKFTLEVLQALAGRLDEPGLEPSPLSLKMAQVKLFQAEDLVMAGLPKPPG